MAKFIIQPHGRLNDWVADEKGYFREAGLDYAFNVEGSRKSTPRLAGVDSPAALKDSLFGAFERYAEGHGRKGEGAGDVSCACHWTVNQAAKVKEGIMWGKAYSVCESAIVVPGDSKVSEPRHLAGIEIAVGYHSGSHYPPCRPWRFFCPRRTLPSNSLAPLGSASMLHWRRRYLPRMSGGRNCICWSNMDFGGSSPRRS